MNKRNVLALADFIEGCELKFNMGDLWCRLHCGSAGCIGGHAALLWPEVKCVPRNIPRHANAFSWDDAKLEKKLGITNEQHEDMCFPDRNWQKLGNCRVYDDITKPVAVAMLRRFAETGKVVFLKDDGGKNG